jgi:phage/plasmid-associated DNA primase
MANFNNLLFSNSVSKTGKSSTHTRIGDKDLNIYGGSFNFDKEEPLFYEGLYDSIFNKNEKQYLTEKQIEDGRFVLDYDFRYCHDVETRQHTKEHIQDIVSLINDTLKKYVIFDKPFRCYVMEKPNVNRLADGSVTKDGIHFMYDFELNDTIKQVVRNDIIKAIPDVIDLPLINTWESVIDEGVVKRNCNWNIYGCRKPANERYELTDIYECEMDHNDGEFMITNPEIQLDFELFKELSVRTRKPILELNKEGLATLNKTINKKEKQYRPSSPTSVATIDTHSNGSTEKIEADIYYKYLNCIGNKMCDRGMYSDTYTVLQILKNENLDIKYVKYWIQRFAYPDSKKYTYAIENYDDPKKIKYTPTNIENRLTIKSLKYFAKKHNPDLYSTYFTDDYDFMIKKKYPTFEKIPVTSAQQQADFANLYYEFKSDRIHLKNDNIYLYYNDEWNVISDKGRMVKHDMYEFYIIYFKVCFDLINDYEKKHIEDEEKVRLAQKYRKMIGESRLSCTKSNDLNCMYQMLLNKLSCVKCSIVFDIGSDNYYNIHFKNGVYDLKKGFRSRLESDYITKYLDYDYVPLTDISQDIQDYVIGFFKKVQPNKEQRDFTLGYLAYCLTGDTSKQIFKMNIGHTASNGKSTELSIHEKCFKNYTQKIDNKVLLLNFEKRHKHLIDLVSQPIRLVYFEEMPKGKKLDVEFIKDFVDGKNISCEIMFGTKSEINIQAKIMSASNHDFQVDTDAGILRRGRVQKYESKFISKDDGELDLEKHIYEKIDGFENKFDNVLYKNAYFHLLLNYIDKLVVPKINKDEFKKTAEDNDNVLTDILNGFTVTKNADHFIGRNEIDLLCGSNKERFAEYKDKLQGMGCKWESQKKYKDTEGDKKWKSGCFIGIIKKEE